jgi:hypothetical protein
MFIMQNNMFDALAPFCGIEELAFVRRMAPTRSSTELDMSIEQVIPEVV